MTTPFQKRLEELGWHSPPCQKLGRQLPPLPPPLPTPLDNSDVLSGRPYGGCAILYQSVLLGDIHPIIVNSRRICAVRVCSDAIKLLLINVYMPYEDDDVNIDEFSNVLALAEDVIHCNSDCHLVLGGDFNVDFRRDRIHTALLNSFCDDVGLMPTIHHSSYNVDYTYNFNMSRFSILDHFISSSAYKIVCT